MKINMIMSRIMIKIIIILSMSLIFTTTLINFFYKKNTTVYSLSSSSEIVMEINSNRILHQVDADKKMFMASTTKILTAITIIENCNLLDVVTVSSKSVGIEGSSIYLVEGDKYTVKDLLFGLMLRSGNDCAETLALHCSKSIKNFAELMNKTAKKIGAVNSNFVNPHGLHDDNHYTTAYDLALISCYAMKNKEFREIVSTKKISITNTSNNSKKLLINKNKMLTQFDGANGIKTGYTKKAGRCLVSSCIRNGIELVCVVLNCQPMFERSKTLLLNSFSDFSNYKIIESDNIIDFIKFDDCKRLIGVYVKKDVIVPLTKEEYENVQIVFDYNKNLSKTIKKDSEIGFVKIMVENNLIFKEKIYNIIDID